MIDRVFVFSKDFAKKNGNGSKLWIIVLLTVVLMFSMMILEDKVSTNVILAVIFTIFAIMIYYAVLWGIGMRSKSVGFATTKDGRIFEAMFVNTNLRIYLSGLAIGTIADGILKNSNGVGANLGGTIGSVAQLYSINKNAEICIKHPEIIASMVEDTVNTRRLNGTIVYEILKVYDIVDSKHSVKVRCDYAVSNSGTVIYNKKLKIYKSYNQFNDLLGMLQQHIL